ncbi:sodium:proton antiporter NhaD [Permianibacter aggregans]|uniref:Sodium/proton antiporter (NhaD family) n=1 Tax=Permianibacter aggregans TaxID=1510150 RepID=A0A4R6UH48_9GAMM|nr:sodium:proton antiporter NhaD [Permianibacter aggregans]QGX41136.1 sodium:proton antiporter [Permianibacter aggregans]TDQ44553.1 sodium/proton antiporter (NhaD family) [Permianibacter aggregans]
MLELLIPAIFVVGYLFIALEHNTHINKAAPALLTGVVLWTIAAFAIPHEANKELFHHLGEISQLLFFLLGAMTIVELVDAHEGFSLVTRYVRAASTKGLIWTVGIATFFLSAVLDNLTTTIVMISLLRRMVPDNETRWPLVAIIVIAANAGGAWSPIGDLTTTMLWLGGQITTTGIITALFIPSLVCFAVPLLAMSRIVKDAPVQKSSEHGKATLPAWERNLVFYLGIGALLFVPIFKTVTHLPPYMGMLFGLSILWATTEWIHRKKPLEEKSQVTVAAVLRRIDVPSVLFFLGILLAVAALQALGQLDHLAGWLQQTFGNVYLINIAIGVLSAVIDNVPLVAAALNMYPIDAVGQFAVDGDFWELLALAAGTGGSCLIIGSAAGVAAMGMENITFGWYLRKVTIPALLGLLAGVGTYAVLIG